MTRRWLDMRPTTQHGSFPSASAATRDRHPFRSPIKHAVLLSRLRIGGRASLPLVLSLVLMGCPASLYYVRPGALEPNRAQVAPEERAAIWRRAVGALLDQGYVPQVLNESASFISARRRDDFVDDALAKTMALVYISSDGGVRVEVVGVGLFHSEQEFIRAVGERQRSLLNQILDRSGYASDPR